jgi:putative membrane protein
MTSHREKTLLFVSTLAALLVSAINYYDGNTWILEVFPVFIGLVLLILTRNTIPLTPLLYRLLFVHALILMVGGHYSYARVPLGSWIQSTAGMQRNPYDRIGHFAQGFVPAILAREILLRKSPLKPGPWLFFVVVCICLAFSALYEMFEWVTALREGSGAVDFLGTQGDPWDTQWDMFMALVGAITSLTVMPGLHDKFLARLPEAVR